MGRPSSLVSVALAGALTLAGAGTALAATAALPSGCAQSGRTVTCTYGPGESTFTAPTGVSTLAVRVAGATGGDGNSAGGARSAGGPGSVLTGSVAYSGGALRVVVGSAGGVSTDNTVGGAGGTGYGAGGSGGSGGAGTVSAGQQDGGISGGGGGGGSALLDGGTAVVVAGGGGGAGGTYDGSEQRQNGGAGGQGGQAGNPGGAGAAGGAGGSGTNTAGGAGRNGSGQLEQGGGGGGGGLPGGGGGNDGGPRFTGFGAPGGGGGAGGGDLAPTGVTRTATNPGAGQVTISYTAPATAGTIAATSGSGQSAQTGQPFAQPLVATVTDPADDGPVQGAAVTFTVSGPASFPGGATAQVTTDANGRATAPTLTAGTGPGQITVTASTSGVAGAATFTGTVTSPSPAVSVRGGGTLTAGGQKYSIAVDAQATPSGQASGKVAISGGGADTTAGSRTITTVTRTATGSTVTGTAATSSGKIVPFTLTVVDKAGGRDEVAVKLGSTTVSGTLSNGNITTTS